MAEIDTPERGQTWAIGQIVRFVQVDTDRYGRSVCHVYLGDRHVNRELVREGDAWVFRKYLRDPSLLEDEAKARAVISESSPLRLRSGTQAHAAVPE